MSSITSPSAIESNQVSEHGHMNVASERLDEVWFDEAPRSSSMPPRSSSAPISVGEFLGDPLADAWLR